MTFRFVVSTLAGALALTAGFLNVAPARAMDFDLVPFGDPSRCGQKCPLVIQATGEITNSTPREFYDFLIKSVRDPRVRSIVFIHSPGGGVEASMRLGRMFRQTKVAAIVARIAPAQPGGPPVTQVPGARCFSACVYALMGAKKRVVPRDSLVGIHRMHYETYERDVDNGGSRATKTYGTREFVATLANYAAQMGVSRELIYTAEKIAPERIHILTPQELRNWRLGAPTF
jgi:hypothetical protein